MSDVNERASLITRCLDIHIEADTTAFDGNVPGQLADVLRRLVNELASVATLPRSQHYDLKDNNHVSIGYAHYDDFSEATENENSNGGSPAPVPGDPAEPVSDGLPLGGRPELDKDSQPAHECAVRELPRDDAGDNEVVVDGRGSSHGDPGTDEVQEGVRSRPERPQGKQGTQWVPRSECEQDNPDPEGV